jgi:hypothetical protein
MRYAAKTPFTAHHGAHVGALSVHASLPASLAQIAPLSQAAL